MGGTCRRSLLFWAPLRTHDFFRGQFFSGLGPYGFNASLDVPLVCNGEYDLAKKTKDVNLHGRQGWELRMRKFFFFCWGSKGYIHKNARHTCIIPLHLCYIYVRLLIQYTINIVHMKYDMYSAKVPSIASLLQRDSIFFWSFLFVKSGWSSTNHGLSCYVDWSRGSVPNPSSLRVSGVDVILHQGKLQPSVAWDLINDFLFESSVRNIRYIYIYTHEIRVHIFMHIV